MNAIYFDMDGTIYDLYSVESWEDRLNAEDVTPYSEGCALGNMEELNDLLCEFAALGVVIGVITWTAMNGSAAYNRAVRKVKKQWVQDNLPCVSEFHCVKYGTPKHKVANIKESILVDDNMQVRESWKNGGTIDATYYDNIITVLQNLLADMARI